MELISQYWLKQQLANLGLNETTSALLALMLALLVTFVVARLGLALGRWLLRLLTDHLLARVSNRLAEQWRAVGLHRRLAHFVPLFLLTVTLGPILDGYPGLAEAGRTLLNLYFLLIVGATLSALLNVLGHWLETRPYAHRIPHQGMIQLTKVLMVCVLAIFALAELLNKSPLFLLSGLGAISAVTMLVFKDTILGFVAGVQLSVNDLLRRGDWIEMPKYGADGDVLEITLNSVKVQNFDKTITTIPAYALISDAFRNWRGMQNSGGRRIKRAFMLDINSVRFIDKALAEQLGQLPLLAPWLAEQGDKLNQQTNVAALRVYLEAYLAQHPHIHPDMTCLVRHLDNHGRGLPIELYCFSSDQRWAEYEAIQAEIFEHVYASLAVFNLAPFQIPTGGDMAQFGAADAFD